MAGKNAAGSHENFQDHGPVKMSSDRSFGIVFAVVFAIIAAIQLYLGRIEWAIGLGLVGGMFLLTALIRPQLLKPLNLLWARFGLLLHKITNPIIMGAIFFLVATPMGLTMRLFGSDPLRRKFDPEAETYWIKRDPPGPTPETMTNQF